MPVNDSPQAVPADLVSVRDAAQAVGLTAPAVHHWIKSGRLTVQPGPGVRHVSLSAVRALCAAPDPQAPDEARLVSAVAPAVGVEPWRIAGWLRRGLLPSWHGRQGRLVRVADVQALAQQRAMAAAAAGASAPMPPDALSVRDAARLSGLSRDRLYTWTKQGLLPVWLAPGGGQRVRLADVTALAERHGRGLPLHPRGAP